jgi:hypothetical protein
VGVEIDFQNEPLPMSRRIVSLETSGADSSALTETVTKISAAITVRPLGTAGRCVGVIIGLFAVCKGEATRMQRSLRERENNVRTMMADWTLNHAKQRVAKDMTCAAELVRA